MAILGGALQLGIFFILPVSPVTFPTVNEIGVVAN